MRNVAPNASCPCESGKAFRACCLPYTSLKAWPPTPDALLRSRYSAYTVSSVEHLYRTYHPTNKAVLGITYDEFFLRTKLYCQKTDYTHLNIIAARPEDAQGNAYITYAADYVWEKGSDGKKWQQSEISRFVRFKGNWVYIDGRHIFAGIVGSLP